MCCRSQVNEITQVGLEAIAAAFAYGAAAVRFLLRAKPRHDVAGLRQTIALAEPILAGLGFAGARVATIETDDPDALGEALRAIEPMDGARQARDLRRRRREARRGAACAARTARRRAGAGRRDRAAGRRAVRHGRGQCRGLHAVSLLRLGLPDRRAVGRSGAADAALCRGRLRAMRAVPGDLPGEGHQLTPQIDFRAATAPSARASSRRSRSSASVCGKPFGVKSSVERVAAKLERQALDVQGFQDAARRHQDVRRLPRRRHGGRAASIRSARRRARSCAPPTIICASASRPAQERELRREDRARPPRRTIACSSSSAPAR